MTYDTERLFLTNQIAVMNALAKGGNVGYTAFAALREQIARSEARVEAIDKQIELGAIGWQQS